MAYAQGFGGGSTNRSSYVFGVGHSVRSIYGGFPAGNPSSTGGNPVAVYSVDVAGLSGGTPSLVSNGDGTFTVRCTSTASQMNFGRLNDNGTDTIDESDSSAFSPRGGLVGSFVWATVPAAPTMLSATPEPGGKVKVLFTGNSDGGQSIAEWQIQYANNPSFTGASTVASSGTTTLTLTPGATYYFRSRGRNSVGWSAWSGALSAMPKSGGKASIGGAWKTAITKVSVGGAWKDAIVRVSIGGEWKDAT